MLGLSSFQSNTDCQEDGKPTHRSHCHSGLMPFRLLNKIINSNNFFWCDLGSNKHNSVKWNYSLNVEYLSLCLCLVCVWLWVRQCGSYGWLFFASPLTLEKLPPSCSFLSQMRKIINPRFLMVGVLSEVIKLNAWYIVCSKSMLVITFIFRLWYSICLKIRIQ